VGRNKRLGSCANKYAVFTKKYAKSAQKMRRMACLRAERSKISKNGRYLQRKVCDIEKIKFPCVLMAEKPGKRTLLGQRSKQNLNMRLNFALTTLLLLATWLLFENFNILPQTGLPGPFSLEKISLQTGCEGTAYLPDQAPSAPLRIKKVVLDAGHGGKDPGCIGTEHKTYEKHNALAIVLKLGGLIEANYPDIDVIYTRETDVFVELKERADIANRNNADLFISIHCNALSVPSAKGTETYVLGLHKAGHNLEVAKRENASIYMEDNYKRDYEGYDPNSTEAHIFGSMWQSAYLEQSILLAGYVQKNVKKTAKREDRGVKQAGFIVLKDTAMPAVLIESGYLTNSSEEGFLLSEDGRDLMATSIFHAFEDYKSHMEGNVPAPAAKHNSGQKPVAKTTPAPKENVAPPKKTTTATPVGNTQKTAQSTGKCRIWLMSWPKKMDTKSGQLGLLGNVREEYQDDAYQYYAEGFANCNDAEKMLPEVLNLGFKKAKIVK
jgi:N-acetylmuramoyl-L-alanine amidase